MSGGPDSVELRLGIFATAEAMRRVLDEARQLLANRFTNSTIESVEATADAEPSTADSMTIAELYSDLQDQGVAVRMKRQLIIKRKAEPVTLDVVVHEAALRRVVGGPKIMSAQLRHMADVSTQQNVQLRVLPFIAGMPMGLSCPARSSSWTSVRPGRASRSNIPSYTWRVL